MAEQDRFARAAIAVARGVARIAREQARGGEVTPQQAETLQLIAQKGALSTSTLATLLGIDPSTASRNLTGLERDGFISRKKGTNDGRQTDVRLTPRGKRTVDAVVAESQQAYATIIEKLPRADRGRVIEALEMLVKALDAEV